MNEVAQTFIRHCLNIPIMITSWFVFFFSIESGFFWSSALAIGVYIVSNFTIKKIQQRRIMKKHQMTLSEYFHIQQQLKEANKKIKALNSQYLKVRSISSFKQLFEMNRLAKRIISLVKSNPKKFYQAEKFFLCTFRFSSRTNVKIYIISFPTSEEQRYEISITRHT